MENSKIIKFELYAQARVANARVRGNYAGLTSVIDIEMLTLEWKTVK